MDSSIQTAKEDATGLDRDVALRTGVAIVATSYFVEIAVGGAAWFAQGGPWSEVAQPLLFAWHGAALSTLALFAVGARPWPGFSVMTLVVAGALAPQATCAGIVWASQAGDAAFFALSPLAAPVVSLSLYPFGWRLAREPAVGAERWTWSIATLIAATTWAALIAGVAAGLLAWREREIAAKPNQWFVGLGQIVLLCLLGVAVVQTGVALAIARWRAARLAAIPLGAAALTAAFWMREDDLKTLALFLGGIAIGPTVAFVPLAWNGWRLEGGAPWWERRAPTGEGKVF